MKELSASLLREKFLIHDPGADPEDGFKPVVAMSNRMLADLADERGNVQETFVVRSQNMHSCARMVARIIQSYLQGGKIMNRHNPFDWEAAWDAIVNDYEHTYNPQRWVAIYNQGKIVFSYGEHHPLLDVIEKCDAKNTGDYDAAIPMAENAFKQTGKVVKLEYEGNVALAVHMEKKSGRCGVILRGPTKTTTFNFSAHAKDVKLNVPQCLSTCAAFLEGIQLAYMIGMNEEKIRLGIIERHSHEEKQTREARRRLTRLNAEIVNLESTYDIRYRPERPEFHHIMNDAEKLAQKILEPPPIKSEDDADGEQAD